MTHFFKRIFLPSSLLGRLLIILLPCQLLVSSLSVWFSSYALENEIQHVYDRSLVGALRAIDLSISTTSGGLALEQPYRLLDFFDLTATGNVYYRIATEDGLAEIGHAALPMPAQPLVNNEVLLFDSVYLGDEAVRVAVMARELSPAFPHQHASGARVIVQVAESLEHREAIIHEMLLNLVLRDLLLITLSTAFMMGALFITFKPLVRVKSELQVRDPQDLSPIEEHNLPSDIQTLVAAINHHMSRYAEQAQRQQQFLDDASHQLRTPLSVLGMQVDYALTEQDPAELHNTLQGMRSGLDRASRLCNQLLSLARAQSASLPQARLEHEPINLMELLQETIHLMHPLAKQKMIRIAQPHCQRSFTIKGNYLLLQEALMNILDNALQYCPAGSLIQAGLDLKGSSLTLWVEDNGPGMNDADRQQAGVRFRRGAAGRSKQGAGLGLAIVDTIVAWHGGQLHVKNAQNSPSGLRCELWFTLDSSPLKGS